MYFFVFASCCDCRLWSFSGRPCSDQHSFFRCPFCSDTKFFDSIPADFSAFGKVYRLGIPTHATILSIGLSGKFVSMLKEN